MLAKYSYDSTVTTRALTRDLTGLCLRLCVGAKLRAASFYKWWLVRQLPTVSSKFGRPREVIIP